MPSCLVAFLMPVERRSRQSLTARLSLRIRATRIFGHSVSELERAVRQRAVPNHWTNLLGVVSAACIVTIFITGFVLMFAYTPASETTTYDGPYLPLHGAEVSLAFDSTMRVSFEMPGGLLIRQAHHWAALLLPASLILQLLSTFFTGGFRRPRRGLWLLLFLIFVVSLIGGWSGYALPDDLLSGTGLRITEGVALGIPFIGTWAASALFGGPFPSDVIEHLYPIHAFVVPGLLLALLLLRAIASWHHKPPQFPGAGRSDDNIIGRALFPDAATRGFGLFLVVIGLLAAISGTVTVNPVWLYGPASPGDASAGSQPDWYTGFLDGALRLIPPGWEFVWLDRTWALAVLVPLAATTVFLVSVAIYPFVEEWVSGDYEDHHLLDRPRNAATRTAIGVAGVVFFGALWLAAGADLISTHFHVAFEHVIHALQAVAILGPAAGFFIAHRICLALQRKDRELLEHGVETGRIVRLPGGEYVEVHRPLSDEERARIGAPAQFSPVALSPDERGVLSVSARVRVRLSRFFFADHIETTAKPGNAELSESGSRPH